MTKECLNIIIPAAGEGRRMKSYGPKPLIKIGTSSIIKNQICLFQTHIPQSNIILVCGFKATTLMNETPNHIFKIENERYKETNVVRSIGMGLRVISNCTKVLVVYGDLVFNSSTLQNISLDESCVIVTSQGMGDEEVGCVIDKNNILLNLMYDLPVKWGQICLFIGQELELLKKLCWEEKNFTKFGFEIINQIIDSGGQFKCIHNKKIKIIDVDSSKDIEKAKEILL